MFIFTIFSFQSNEIFLKKRVSKKFYLYWGFATAIARFPTQHTIKITDYQNN